LGAQKSLWSRLYEITCPVLWLTGEDDKIFSAIGARASELIANAKFVEIKEAGHRLPWQRADEFIKKVTNFLEEFPS
jgi:2-succinyl-6-hydroxy-2,4-cyclohexadiene-1-carboxylate synthase